jgi:HSP90 family molecular chaperone
MEHEEMLNEHIENTKIKIDKKIINEIGKNAKIDMTKYKGFISEFNNMTFLRFSIHEKQSSIYTINLKTLKPTSNSEIKVLLSNEIIKKLNFSTS